MLKRLVSAALCMALIMGIAPTAFAAEDNENLEKIEVVIPEDGSVDLSAESELLNESKNVTAAPEQGNSSGAAASQKNTAASSVTTKTTAKTTAETTKKTTKATTKVTTKATTKAVSKTVKLTQGITMYKGESRTLDIIGSKYKYTVKSKNAKIVYVNGKKITAKKCGTTYVVVTVKSGRNTYIVNIKITVKISSYNSSVKFSQTKTPKDFKRTALIMHKGLKIGSTMNIKPTGYDKISYQTTDKKIATVNSKGVVTGKGKGVTIIKAIVTAGKESFIFYTKVHVYKSNPSPSVSQKTIDSFFGSSGFVGSSIGVGQQNYFNSMGYNFLGHPTMMVRGCYAFHNDGGANGSQYQIAYGGVTGMAKNVIKRSGVKRVFINMGTNDMFGNAESVFERYKSYLEGIRAVNPNVPIYIEAMTPIYSSGQRGNLTNYQVNRLNELLAGYAKKQSDIYYIDINTPLKAGTSSLPAKYSSDKYVHLTNAAYKVWTDTMVEYVEKQLIAEQKAKDAVATYTENKTADNLKTAKAYVNKLEKGSLKSSLTKKLK